MNSSQETEEEEAAESVKMYSENCQREQNKVVKYRWGRGDGQDELHGAKPGQRKQSRLYTTRA